MRIPGRTAHGPIGIDIGARSIKCAQVIPGERGAVLAAASLGRLRPGAALDREEVARLVEVLERKGFAGRRAVVAAPADRLMTAILELPPRESGAPLEELARMELARANKREPGSFALALWDLPAPPNPGRAGATHVMATACAHTDSQPLLDLLEAEGLDVCAMDVQPWAAARACGTLSESAGTPEAGHGAATGVLDWGWTGAALVLLHKGVVVYERRLPDSGLRPLHAALCQRLSVDAEVADHVLSSIGLRTAAPGVEAGEELVADAQTLITEHVHTIATELTASFSYTTHRYAAPVGRLVLIGGGAAMPGLAEHLTPGLGIPVRIATLSDAAGPAWGRVGGRCDPEADSPALMTALGLARYSERQAA
jgi:Tfp pilus assembly PilM family ATPase